MIDDKPADGEMVRRYLEDEAIPWATDLELVLSLDEALSVVSERRFDVLIIDYRFPFGNGFDVLKRLRQEGVEAPALMLTGEGDESVAARAVKRQLQDYIPKGDLTPETLRESLRTIQSKHSHDSSPPTQTTGATDRIGLENLAAFLPVLSDKLRQGEHPRILFLRILLRGSTESLNLESILEETFREVALEPLTFHRVNPDGVMTLLKDPISETFTLEEPAVSVLDGLREVIEATTTTDEDIGFSVKGGIAEAKGSHRDPAALLNQALDVLRYQTEEEGDRLVRITIADNHE